MSTRKTRADLKTTGEALSAEDLDELATARINLILPGVQNAYLTQLSKQTGLQRTELVRHAIALLGVAMKGRSKGLELAMVDDEDRVVSHIASAL